MWEMLRHDMCTQVHMVNIKSVILIFMTNLLKTFL